MQTMETGHFESHLFSEGGRADKGEIFADLMHLAVSRGITVKFVPFQFYDSRLKGTRLGIRQSLSSIDEINYILAHEIAHAYLHCGKGDTMNSVMHDEYEEQADRASQMLLDMLRMKVEAASCKNRVVPTYLV